MATAGKHPPIGRPCIAAATTWPVRALCYFFAERYGRLRRDQCAGRSHIGTVRKHGRVEIAARDAHMIGKHTLE